jgi:hypothetical protein
LLTAQKDTPAPAAPLSSQQNRGFLRREDYYTINEVATKKREKPAFLLGEIANPPRVVHRCRTPQNLTPNGSRGRSVAEDQSY